ncbi:MAG: class I SAM-dependent methyltransferase [Ignavibacteriaceae bacterium]|nr:class I SAM-dependent methyltransferase [Ignavibacteriaceae bacterium]
MKNLLPNNSFFDELASDYDQMVSFEKAVENKKRILKNFITPGMKYAADLGCGSGVDSIAFASSGLKVTAFDPSVEMLEVAKENAEREKVRVAFHNNSIDSISEDFDDQFDLAVSLGNTFANIDRERLIKSLQRCKQILKPQGILLIQVLNYEKIINEKQRIVNITKGADKFFIRFYDFIDNEITFNILIFKKEKPSEHKLISTKLFPHTRDDFDAILKKLEFSKVEYFSEFELATFHKEQSKDLIIRAIKE